MRGAPTTVATWDQQALKVFLTWRSHDPVVGSIPRLLGLLPEQQSHAKLRSSVGEDDISLLLDTAPDRIGAAACNITGDTLEVTKLAKVQCVKSFSSLAVIKVSDLTCLYIQEIWTQTQNTRNLNPSCSTSM